MTTEQMLAEANRTHHMMQVVCALLPNTNLHTVTDEYAKQLANVAAKVVKAVETHREEK